MNLQRIELLKQFVAQEPDNPFNTYALAMEYYDGDPEKSLELLEKLMQTHPDYLPTFYKAAHLYWKFDELEKAEYSFATGIGLAEKQQDAKAQKELKSAYLNFKFEVD